MDSLDPPHPGQLFDVTAVLLALMEKMGAAIVIWHVENPADPAGIRLVAASEAASCVANVDFSAAVGKTIGEILPFAVARGRHQSYVDVVALGIGRPLDPDMFAGGREGVVAGRLVPLPNACVGVVFEDHTLETRAAEEERRKLTTFLHSIIDNIPAKVFVKDAKHLRFALYNRLAEKLSGRPREQTYGKTDYDFFPREQAEFFQARDREVLESGQMVDIPEEPIDYHDGRRWLHTKKIPLFAPDGSPEYLLGISLDITERKVAVEALKRAHEELEVRVLERTNELVTANDRLKREIDERKRTQEALEQAEEELRHAQKMQAVGKLAGGIAHDFNNLLSVIISYAAVLSAKLEPETPLAQGLHEIKMAGERAANLTRQLLAFSRQQVLAPSVVDLNEVVGKLNKMLRRLIGEDLELRTNPAPELDRIKADPGQLEQVIMNLVVNARDAMPGGGRLTIETANVELDEAYAHDHLGVVPGRYVLLSVADTGIGMDKATLARIFEPFFTTKEIGKGTGLGLSTVFGIVKQSGGYIWVDSYPGQGTTFKIYFARTDETSLAEGAADATCASLDGSETILLVEDEPQVRAIARSILEERGYNVIVARDPEDALAIGRERTEPIDLLLTDVVMPGINGRLLSDRLLVHQPNMEVLFMSGYADQIIGYREAILPGSGFLQKPITPLNLATMVRRLLDAKARREIPRPPRTLPHCW